MEDADTSPSKRAISWPPARIIEPDSQCTQRSAVAQSMNVAFAALLLAVRDTVGVRHITVTKIMLHECPHQERPAPECDY